MRKLNAAFTLLLIAVVVYRAVVLSFTYDEAYTVCVYAADGARIFSPKDFYPNNQVFHTLLVWLMFQLAGWTEWTLRLPALLGGVGCILMLRHLGLYLFASSKGESDAKTQRDTLFLTAIVALHPLIFQFFSFARGYSLSLFFSMLGFYALLRLLEHEDAEKKTALPPRRRLLLLAGVAFGLSVASNLTAALMNTALILAALSYGLLRGSFRPRELRAAPLWFCLPGLAIVLVLYGPFLLYVPLSKFDYASATPWDAVFDLTAWTLGHTIAVLPEARTWLLLGIPVAEETYWLAVILTPYCVVLPLLVAAAAALWNGRARSMPNDAALYLVFVGLTLYAVILLTCWQLGKNVFPCDRTGMFPLCYAMMLPVLLLRRTSPTTPYPLAASPATPPTGTRFVPAALFALIVLTLIQFAGLFSLPYYHNFWSGDAPIRGMFQKIRPIIHQTKEPGRIICSAGNELAVEFYRKKYGLEHWEQVRLLRKEDIASFAADPRQTIYILPADGEELFRNVVPEYDLFERAPYTGLLLMVVRRRNDP